MHSSQSFYYCIKVVSHALNNGAGNQEMDCSLLSFYPLTQRSRELPQQKCCTAKMLCTLQYLTMFKREHRLSITPKETIVSIPISHYIKASPQS